MHPDSAETFKKTGAPARWAVRITGMVGRMQQIKHRALAVAMFALAALPALAAGGGDGESNIFAGDIGNVFWTLVTFGLVLFVLGKFVWGPLTDMIQKREDFIRESLDQAKSDRESAEARLAELEKRLNDARAEATAIVDEGRRDAEVVRQKIEADAKAEAEKMVERAKREIGIARETAVKELYELSGNLAAEIAGRIVGRELQAKDHENLISEALDELQGKAN